MRWVYPEAFDVLQLINKEKTKLAKFIIIELTYYYNKSIKIVTTSNLTNKSNKNI